MRKFLFIFFIILFSAVSGFAKDKDKAISKINRDFFLENIWNYEENPDSLIFEGDKPVLIDFYADWCGPCRIAAPILEEVAQEYVGKVNVYKVNTDIEQRLSAELSVTALPTFLLIKANGEANIIKGVGGSKEEIKAAFTEVFDDFLLAD